MKGWRNWKQRMKTGSPWGHHPATCEVEYTAEEIEFMLAMDKEKRRMGRMPTCGDVLRVARRLGYRRVE